jgi:predicted transcriptional regulator
MAKETRLTFRVRSELKENLETIAAREARSVAQVCEAILHDGVLTYQKQGSRYLQRVISNYKKN